MQILSVQREFAVGCIAFAMAWTAGCGTTSSPATPTAPNPTTLVIIGSTRLTAPGQATQLLAQVMLLDGSKTDATSTVHWASSDQTVAAVSSSGLVTAVDFGKTTISANADPAAFASVIVTVLPEGTYILAGRVMEADDFPAMDVRIELIGGQMSGRVAMTDAGGWYQFKGVADVLQVRASKDGYLPATRNVSADTEHVDFKLTTSVPPADVKGVYRLTFTASARCQLPDDARRRTYTATIEQQGADATVRLTGAQFYTSGYCGLMNSFNAHVHGNTVTLSDWGGDCAIVEQLDNMRYLILGGTAEAIVTPPTPAAFNASVFVSPGPADGSKPIAACTASDHQLLFEQMLSTVTRDAQGVWHASRDIQMTGQ